MNNIFKIPAFQRRKAIPKQIKDLELLPLNEQFSKLTMSIVGDDDLRPVMTGNFFAMESKKIVSTDAHKLTAINMPKDTFNFIAQKYNKELDKEPKGLIFHTLSQLQKDYNKLMKNNNITISFDEFINDRAIEDGRYPNYEAVIPKEFTNEIYVDYSKLYWYAKVLLDAKVIDDTTKINTSNANEYQNKKIEYLKDSYVPFLPYTKQIILTYTLDGKQEYIGFNARLLCDLLKFAMEFNGKTFGLVGLSGNSRAMVIELENGLNVATDSIGIVMPVMLVSGQFDNTIGDSDFNNNVVMYYDLDTNSIISDKVNYPINESIGFMPNKTDLSTSKIRVKEEAIKVENSSADLIDILTRIKGYKIALKVAKEENKANIEKKIKGLEIAKRMKKDDLPFKNGGNVDEDISWDITIRDEYDNETFEINVRGYFENEEDAIKQAIKDYDIYVDESDYGKMYWNGNEITIYGAKKNYKKGGMVEYHDYKGVEIMYEPTYEEYFVNDLVFNSLEKAQKYIDSGEANKPPTYIENLYRRGAMAKGGSVNTDFKDYIVYSYATKNDVIKDNYEIEIEEVDLEITEQEIIRLYQQRRERGYIFAFKIYDKATRNKIYESQSYQKTLDEYEDEEYKMGGSVDEQTYIDLFEDYENIPAEVQMILDEYSESFEDGDYIGLSKAQNELEQIGYTFDFYVDGDAYGLRPINVKLSQIQGYEDEDEEYKMGGGVDKMKFKATLNYWNPRNESVVTESGFRYRDMKSVITKTQDISDNTEIGLFEQFYKLNNSLRYSNGSYYEFQDANWEQKYGEWLKSDDYNQKSFNLYYGKGVVD